MVGRKYGHLTILGIKKQGYKYPGIFLCDCGKKTVAEVYKVKKGEVKSCGCQRIAGLKASKIKHGHTSYSGPYSSEYTTWAGIIQRCNNPNCSAYKNYGGRGIKVHKPWLQFSNFLKDVGLKPDPKLTIDRIDNDGNYEPGNVRWATRTQQKLNQRMNKTNKSGEKNIHYANGTKLWILRYVRDGKTVYFKTGKTFNEVLKYKLSYEGSEDYQKYHTV